MRLVDQNVANLKVCKKSRFVRIAIFFSKDSYEKIKKKSLEDEIDLLPASFKARAPHVYPSDPALQFSVAHPWSGF